MSEIELAFDILLIACSIMLAVAVLTARDIMKGVIIFLLFGLMISLAWVRLHAPDVALAEAAVGAGITGVLLMQAVHAMKHRNGGTSE